MPEVELRRVRMPLAAPFHTAHGTSDERDVLLVRVDEGWAECAAPADPTYTSEYTDGAHRVLRDHLVPRYLADPDASAQDISTLLADVRGHHMAKAALEGAVLDAALRAEGRSLASYLGATRPRVPAGIAIGMTESVGALVEQVEAAVAEGYGRVKLKVQPGWDVEPVRAVRARFADLDLQVDGNGSYRLDGEGRAEALEALDQFDLLLIEQPLPPDDLLGSAAVARRLRTPVCLDESITSPAAARAALALGACSVLNVKPGRVGGLLTAKRIHDEGVAAGVPMWVGGMSETGIGRAALLALAALPGFNMTGDLSASARWFDHDITPPFALDEGMLAVPDGPGIGVDVLLDALDACTTSVERLGQA
ncbi:MAG: o-succinylbenzoate synthase [Acidimicrobiaceae bacterium]|nr:o-succinylbenzoate synthase [Acidimicrobiaceae bacterium]